VVTKSKVSSDSWAEAQALDRNLGRAAECEPPVPWNQGLAAQGCAGIHMTGRDLDSPQAPLRGDRPFVAKTPLQWRRLREGFRLQFTAFDASYLERLQGGDARTAQHFTAYFGELIQLKLRSRLRSREAIEDVRQETFVRVLALVRTKDGVRQPERLGALVNSVCNHVLMEYYRSHRGTDSNIDEQPEGALIAAGVSVSGLVEVDDAARTVRKILGDLSERDRRLLQSVLLEERDKDEVCAELGLSRDHLRVLVHRAKQAFKSYYAKRQRETKDETKERL
jgi:RNA polymerase sigma-70 factor, ECF subfamily